MSKIHRKDPNKKRVKDYLLQKYRCTCMLCEKHFKVYDLTLHHCIPWRVCHITTIEICSTLCECCHKQIHYEELHNKQRYEELNNKIIEYKTRAS